MTYRKHPRRMTDEQFADGTTIDGSRIDKAMEEVADHFNDLPKGDMGRRFVQSQYVAGWQPWSKHAGQETAKEGHHMPWLPTINWPMGSSGATWTGSVVGSTPLDIKNKHRFKGSAIPGVSLDVVSGYIATSDLVGMQWAWTRKMHFSEPVIIQDITLHLGVDWAAGATPAIRPYQNDFKFDGLYAPSGYRQNGYTQDLSVLLDVDHPFTPEDTQMKSLVVLRKGFTVADSAFSLQPLGATPATAPGYVDMLPPFQPQAGQFDCETVGGVLLRISDINAPLPARSRIRFAVIIPQYKYDLVRSGWGDAPAGATRPAERPWASQSYTATVTVLEEVSGV